MLRLIGVTKRFEDIFAVSNLSLEIKQGEIYALIGPNGSGKTTTLKLITQIYKPDRGTIKVEGRLGYIPDEPNFYAGLTGYETINFIAKLYRVNLKKANKLLAYLIRIFSLKNILNDEVRNYSRGNKQKLAIITQLLIQPDLLLIDEPILGLDPPSAHAALTLFNDFAARGGSILLCTHTLPVVVEIANRIGFLKQGRLVQEITNHRLQLNTLYSTFIEFSQ